VDSLSFNRNAQNINSNNKVSFTGQKSIIDISGTQTYRFYAPPYDNEKYYAALELVSVDYDKDSRNNNTGNYKAEGKPVLIPESISSFNSPVNGLSNLSFDVTADKLKEYRLNKDVVGYRFVLLDKKTFNETKNIDAAIEAAKWTDDNGYKHTSYLLDSGHTASTGPFEDYSYFSKKQGFVNKTGPMYHIFPDAYNVEKANGNKNFVRTPFNKAGGNIQGMIEKIRQEDGELSPYEMIITTPLFGADDVSSHGYWTANPFQVASTKGTLEDFKELQTAVFDAGKTYVTDGAFTSFGLEAPQLHHVLKHGKKSPFYGWMKLDKTDAPNLNIKLGVFPDKITTDDALLENTRFKIVNPKYIESEEGNRNSKRKPNPDYNSEKPTYIQFFDDRLAGSQADDLVNLITIYENQNPENHYDIATHQDSVQPFYFEVDPADTRFQTRGASLKDLQNEGKQVDTYFQMNNYTITTKSEAGGANSWDGQVDLLKANISNPTNNPSDVIGNKQVKNHYYNIASYWTKLTDDALIEHISRNIGKNGNAALSEIAKKHRINPAELNSLSYIIETPEFNKNFNEKFKNKTDDAIVLESIVNFPLESVEFAPDLTAVLSTQYITPRPLDKNTDENLSRTKLLENMPKNAQSLYKDSMQKYMMSVLGELDAKMPKGQKLFNGGNITPFTDYGKYVADIVAADIMKYGVVKALFPDEELVEFAQDGRAEYAEDLKYKGLISLGINEPGKAENEANALLKQLKEGFNELQKDDNSDLVDSLYTRFKDVKLDDIKMARAIVNKTGAGLNWRFDAAKDVSDLDKRRANDPHTSFEKCWDDTIDFWGGFIKNIRKHNPAAYTIAEVTNLWEFSRWQYSNKNKFALDNIKGLESINTAEQKYALLEFYLDNKDKFPPNQDKMADDIKANLDAKANITYKEISQNSNIITDRETRALMDYYFDNDIAMNAMQKKDFGKYIDPNIAERMLYEKTGATTGSNYDTFFGLYPELFGQNFEHGTTNDYRLYNMGAFESGLKGFFSAHSPQFINHSHIFTNNHDKPRPLHCIALDMELFLSDLKTDEQKSRAKAVTGSNDFDHISSMAVAVGERYLEMFENSYDGIISKEELKTVKQAIADLTLGKFLDNTKGSMENSRTFGYLPFDITLKDVMQQARYLSETKGMKWGISEGKKSSDKDLSVKETELFNAAFSELAPDTEKLSAMLRMMMFSVGVPTLFAGDEMAHSGYETPTKNVELAIRNIIHHSWLDDNAEGKEFVKELYNHTTAAANVHKMKGLSALADGSSLIVPQKSKGDNPQKDKAAHTALFKYNDKGSNVLVVYSNKQMDTENKNTGAYLSGETDNVPYISLGYIDPHKEVDATDVDGKTVYEIKDDGTVTDKPVKENAIAGNVAKDGDKYKKLKYNPSTAQYEPGKETYEVKNGKLIREGMATGRGISSPPIELDDVANVFYKVS